MWYVVQTTSGEEKTSMDMCMARLEPFLYKEMFVPMYIDKMHFRKQWHDVKKVLFPGYFFVDTQNIEAVLKEMQQVNRLTKVLKNADAVSPISKDEQEFLAGMMNEQHIIECSTGFIIGGQICITDGPLRNHYGIIKKIDRHRRIAKLEINFFGRMTPVEVGLEILARLSEEQFEKLKEDKLATYDSVKAHVGTDNAGTDSVSDSASSEDAKVAETGNASDNTRREDAENIPKMPDERNERFVRIKSGVFAGLHGVLVGGNDMSGEWRVRIDIFENPTEVVFSGDEIEM